MVLDGAAAHLAHDDPWHEGGHGILTTLLRAYTEIRLWDLSSLTRPKPLGQALTGHPCTITSLA